MLKRLAGIPKPVYKDLFNLSTKISSRFIIKFFEPCSYSTSFSRGGSHYNWSGSILDVVDLPKGVLTLGSGRPAEHSRTWMVNARLYLLTAFCYRDDLIDLFPSQFGDLRILDIKVWNGAAEGNIRRYTKQITNAVRCSPFDRESFIFRLDELQKFLDGYELTQVK